MEYIVPAALGGLVLLIVLLVSAFASGRARRIARKKAQAAQGPKILIHSINDDRCTGCDACVAVCPTNVLDLIDNKSRVLHFQDCIQCEACMWACPTEALVMHPEGTEPPEIKTPDLDEFFQTRVPGQYLIGEVAGKPLVKNAANLGRAVVEHMLAGGIQPGALAQQGGVDVLIVGAGPGGLSAALSCVQRGLSFALLDKEHILASTIARYPKGKLIMAEPYDCENFSLLPVFDSSKEEMIPIWEDLVQRTGIQVKYGEAVEIIERQKNGVFEAKTGQNKYRSQRVVLSTGLRGKPRTLGVRGEEQAKVMSLLEDPDDYRGQAVCVVGGGDSALEAAIALADAGGKVVLTYRGRSFNRAAPKNKQTAEAYAAQRRIKILYQSQVAEFGADTVSIKVQDGRLKVYPNHASFVLIGADPPIKWLSTLGIEYVKRPHMAASGRPEAMVQHFVPDAIQCPETAAEAAALVKGHTIEEELGKRPLAAESRAKRMIKSASRMLSGASKLERPMPLSEFAKQNRRRHQGRGRRDQLSPGERTRMLRMLRDEGGRLADEDSHLYVVESRGGGGHDDPGGMSMDSAYGSQPPDGGSHGGGDLPAYPNDSLAPGQELISVSVPQDSLAPMTLDGQSIPPDGVQPKKAVIVGLARATAEGPRATRDRHPHDHDYAAFAETDFSSPGEIPEEAAPQDEFSGSFHSVPEESIVSVAEAPTSLPPGELQINEFDEQPPTRGVTPEELFEAAGVSAPDDATRMLDTRDPDTRQEFEDAATRAVDLEQLTSEVGEETRLVDTGENPKDAPKSIHDVDWDLD